MIEAKDINRTANSFYNQGLSLAGRRDLTGAIRLLKTCLALDKYHTDARNLLGLIYYEMGEISEALYQWVISTNLQSRNNRSKRYLDLIREDEHGLSRAQEDIQRYNTALAQAKSGTPDLAILQLLGAVEHAPHFVKAHLLLALLYMESGQYSKAGKYLMRVLQIDKQNPRGLYYMDAVRRMTGREEMEHRKLRYAFSHRQMTEDDVIIPKAYKEDHGWLSFLQITGGLVLGACAMFFLVMPTRIKQQNQAHTQELLTYQEQLNQKNETIDDLNGQVQQANADRDSAQGQLDSILNNSDSAIAQYNVLVQAEQAVRSGDMAQAAALYPQFNTDQISDETIRGIADGLKQEIATRGYQTIEDTAYARWEEGHHEEAVALYQSCLAIRPDNPKVLYYLGLLSKAQGKNEDAINYFTQVTSSYPEAEQAGQAAAQLAQLQAASSNGQ